MSKAAKPYIGATVQYVAARGGYRAAIVIGIITALDPSDDVSLVNLAVFNDGPAWGAGPIQVPAVMFSDDPQPHTWHWPEKA